MTPGTPGVSPRAHYLLLTFGPGLIVGGCAVHLRMSNSTPGLYLLSACRIISTPPPSCHNQKMTPDAVRCPLGVEHLVGVLGWGPLVLSD